MNIDRMTYLYRQYQRKALTDSERDEWDLLLASPDLDEALRGITGEDWDSLSEDAFLEMKSERSREILSGIMERPQERVRLRRLWPRIAVAAAVATLVFGAGLFYYTNQNLKSDPAAAVVQDVAPGKVGATLTLASGKKIVLSEAVDGELAKEAGVVISKSADGKLVYEIKGDEGDENKINVLSTSRGETYELRLPDGSLVALNATSSLEYPANFNRKKERKVKLTGEGYFEVAKDKAHPFIVETDKQQVEVLGTHFNINSYDDEPATATTLLEGSVKVSSGSRVQMLKPGEQAVYDGKVIKVQQADTESITDWKDGDFYLNHVDFKTAMRKIGRWYDVEIIYDASVPDDIVAGGWISRENKLSAVLRLIEKSRLVKFKVEGKKVYVSR